MDIELYKIFRDHINREKDLMNQRLTWVLYINGFLFAAYGITLQKQFDPQLTDISLVSLFIFQVIICLIGLTVTFSGLKSINAAVRATKSIMKMLHDQTDAGPRFGADFAIKITRDSKEHSAPQVEVYVPSVVGGGMKGIHEDGLIAVRRIPLVLMTTWLLFALICITVNVVTLYFKLRKT